MSERPKTRRHAMINLDYWIQVPVLTECLRSAAKDALAVMAAEEAREMLQRTNISTIPADGG